MIGCPFCSVDPTRIFYEDPLVVGIWDAYPVNPGHALLVPRRHVASWFDATLEEQTALIAAIADAKAAIEARHAPHGYNLGVNVGAAAGQTVPHLHLHVIPRYEGDTPDPRGGVRHVIPARGNYLVHSDLSHHPSAPADPSDPSLSPPEPPQAPRLIRGEDDPLLPHLVVELATADRADLAVAFVLPSGVDRLEEHFRDLLRRGGRLRMVTGDYFGMTDPVALSRLLDMGPGLDLRVFETDEAAGHAPEQPPSVPGSIQPVTVNPVSFHPKAYIFHRASGRSVAFVGSSNLSQSALGSGVEWNYRIVADDGRSAEAAGGASPRADGSFATIQAAFERLLAHPRTRPVDAEWIERYRKRRPAYPVVTVPAASAIAEPPEPAAAGEIGEVAVPHAVQHEALAALERTRSEGNEAGLVVLATGLGKTWLSAFDSDRPEFRRVLFVAHREEILDQALRTFRRVRPYARLGRFSGEAKDTAADVLFASVQTISRAEHLRRFPRHRFDYLVVDEFHHAAAHSYRKVLDHFTPRFLLGLTATPERTDGGDLLALCGGNLVFRCDLAEGIRRGLLSPFHYYGVPDEVDYRNIPWRNTRFDEEELTRHVATQARAANALDQLRRRGGSRTVAFCVSQRHADFMAGYLGEQGLRAAAVHAGPTSAPRAASLEKLSAGELDVVCAVDMFNEGVDLPLVDTVLMLRPTESKLLWLQQLGRGLRKAEGKQALVVIDYIGNHRTFLLKPQALFGLEAGDGHVRDLLARLEVGEVELPPGCRVTYELEAIDILRGLLRVDRSPLDALGRYLDDFVAVHGVRPTAAEAHHDGFAPRSGRGSHGSWLELVADRVGLPPAQSAALAAHRPLLRALEATEMTRSYKMLVLEALLDRDELPGGLPLAELAAEVARIARRSPVLASELREELGAPAALEQLLVRNPIAAWTGGRGTGGVSYFTFEDGRFATRFTAPAGEEREGLQQLVRELVDWRLAEYTDRRRPAPGGDVIPCKVSHASGRPILFLPDRAEHPGIPEGPTAVTIEGEGHEAVFAKVAVNVVRRVGGEENVLPEILRRWFGPTAGAPGTNRQVTFRRGEGRWTLEPVGPRRGRAEQR